VTFCAEGVWTVMDFKVGVVRSTEGRLNAAGSMSGILGGGSVVVDGDMDAVVGWSLGNLAIAHAQCQCRLSVGGKCRSNCAVAVACSERRPTPKNALKTHSPCAKRRCDHISDIILMKIPCRVLGFDVVWQKR